MKHLVRSGALATKAAWLGIGILVSCAGPASGQQSEHAADLENAVSLVLARNCLACHSGEQPSGELDLTRPNLAARGPELRDDAISSALWQRVADGEMPPDDELPPEDFDTLKAWIDAGAPWTGDTIDPLAFSTSTRAGRDWWSLQPIAQPSIPTVAIRSQVRNPIDAFLLAELERLQLSFAAPASPRTQLRRVYFDLVGLPPPLDVLEVFERDPSDAAYEEIVERLLASPEYGERWARHWLDVVRYGESDGFERNAPREQMWHYRDWVIDALNQDMPFDEFARRQLCGDAIDGDPLRGKAATGFLVAGVHNTVVGSSRTMQLLARQDELEDLVGNAGQAFVGLTLNCARCHDHKFDPITQREYYQLVAVFAGVQHGVAQVREAAAQKQIDVLDKRRDAIRSSLRTLEEPARAAVLSRREPKNSAAERPAVEPALRWSFTDESGGASSPKVSLHGDSWMSPTGFVVDGDGDYAISDPLPLNLRAKTLEVWLELANRDQQGGAAISIETNDGIVFDAIVFAEREPGMWMAGSNGFVRTQSFGGIPEDAEPGETVHLAITYSADGEITCYRNGAPYGSSYQTEAPPEFAAGAARVLFGLRHSPAGGNRFLSATIRGAHIYDRALTAEEVAASARSQHDFVSESELVEALDDDGRSQRTQLLVELAEVIAQRNELAASSMVSVYTNTSIAPETTPFLPRGDVTRPGEPMRAGTTRAIPGLSADFGLDADADDVQRRRRFADWVTDPANPLFPRVAVNRLWQHHFGRGLVTTPSDFGFNGGRASHPQLLDWLAGELRREDYRLKPLHRLMVTSTAYRQASTTNPAAMAVDAENRWLWRKSPTRLDAEVVRDSMLVVAGKLNVRRGGPSFKDVEIIDQNNGTTYYREIDREDPELNRRTIYRFSPRGGRSALLDTLDCPDPSASAPRRTVTTTPLQALSLLNNALVLRLSDAWGAQIASQFPGDTTQQVTWMFRTALSRPPDGDELSQGVLLVDRHGAAALARALFNSSEFVVVE